MTTLHGRQATAADRGQTCIWCRGTGVVLIRGQRPSMTPNVCHCGNIRDGKAWHPATPAEQLAWAPILSRFATGRGWDDLTTADHNELRTRAAQIRAQLANHQETP